MSSMMDKKAVFVAYSSLFCTICIKFLMRIIFYLQIRGYPTDIGTQQLDFLSNCQCRLSFLDNMHMIQHNTAQMGCLSIVGAWTLLPFSGAL